MPVPQRVAIDSERQTLAIDWADGSLTKVDLDALRRACPCAHCREQRTHDAPFPTGPWTDVQAETVGGYGLRIEWDGGHNDGIFTWDRLHAMGTEAD